jgi:alkylation response protein AidB-like acyl-CoA dehydrogenase
MHLSSDERDDFRASVRGGLATVIRTQAGKIARDQDPAAIWRYASDVGWPGLLVAEAYGGTGAGMEAAAIVCQEIGRVLAPGQFLASAVLAAVALAGAEHDALRDRWLPEIADGSAVGAVAVTVGGMKGSPTGEGWVLDGKTDWILDGGDATFAILPAAAGVDGEVLVLIDLASQGVTRVPVMTVDRTRRLAAIVCDGAAVPPASVIACGGSAAEARAQLAAYGLVAVAADSVGGIEAVLQLAIDYARDRKQFGRPIGSFQAVKHKLASMYVAGASSSAAVEAAARALDEGDLESSQMLVAAAGHHAIESYVSVAGDAIQVHGGVAMTWEHDCQLFFKRAWLNRNIFGGTAQWRETYARGLVPTA